MLARGLNAHLEFRTKEVAEQVRKNVLFPNSFLLLFIIMNR